MNIIVNGKSHHIQTVPGECYYTTYERVVEMAGRDPSKVWTVVFTTRDYQDTMLPGRECILVEGMVFNVADTSNA